MTDNVLPEHSIIKDAWKYEIVSFHYVNNLDDKRESYIDMTLRKDNVIRRLRFNGPQNLKIEPGFPEPTRGMIILDVKDRQLEDLKVEVFDYENSSGSVTFLAREVIDLDKQC